MLQRFMKAARFALSQFPTWRSQRRGKGKIKSRSTDGGQAAQLRKQQNRTAKHGAVLHRFPATPHASGFLPALIALFLLSHSVKFASLNIAFLRA